MSVPQWFFDSNIILLNLYPHGTIYAMKNELLCLRIRKEGETIEPNDVVLFDEMFMPIGFATSCGSYYSGQVVTTSMSGKVIYKQT